MNLFYSKFVFVGPGETPKPLEAQPKSVDVHAKTPEEITKEALAFEKAQLELNRGTKEQVADLKSELPTTVPPQKTPEVAVNVPANAPTATPEAAKDGGEILPVALSGGAAGLIASALWETPAEQEKALKNPAVKGFFDKITHFIDEKFGPILGEVTNMLAERFDLALFEFKEADMKKILALSEKKFEHAGKMQFAFTIPQPLYVKELVVGEKGLTVPGAPPKTYKKGEKLTAQLLPKGTELPEGTLIYAGSEFKPEEPAKDKVEAKVEKPVS